VIEIMVDIRALEAHLKELAARVQIDQSIQNAT
jgi:hypothetical protein